MAQATWSGLTLRTTFRADLLPERDAFADAARAGDWPAVFARLETSPELVNTWRPGGPTWFTPVHQLAWHGAGLDVARRLLAFRPWLTLRTAAGDRPADIAARGGYEPLADLLRPKIRNPVPTDTLAALRRHLHDLIRHRAEHLVDRERLRLPELDVLTELEQPELWFPVPGMTGGFHCVLHGVELEVSSWVRVVEGSGETHRVTAAGRELVAEGYV